MRWETRSESRVISILQENGACVGLAFLLLLATCVNSRFLTLENLGNVFRQASVNGIIALGVMLTILIAQIDLSVGSTMSLAGFVALYFNQHSLALGLLMPLFTGAAAGCLNAFLVAKMRITAFIATLSTMLFLRGVTLVLTGENTYKAVVSIPAFDYIGRGSPIPHISTPAIILLVCLAAYWIILNRTPLGRSLYACGGNEEAALMMGIRVNRAKWFAYVSSGVLSAVAGIILASRVGAAYPLSGDGGELDAIAATVIGGTLLSGGKGTVSGTLVGALIVALLRNIFNMQSTLSTHWEKVITGSLVLAVVLAQSAGMRRRHASAARGRRDKPDNPA